MCGDIPNRTGTTCRILSRLGYRDGPGFDIGRSGANGDSNWAILPRLVAYDQTPLESWRTISPHMPGAPDEVVHFTTTD
jgi:hypothetical protein